MILVSNSYWIGEDTPCLTFGLRGVIHATLKVGSRLVSALVRSLTLRLSLSRPSYASLRLPTLQITSDQPDLHSGMQGGVVSEPLVDMVRLLASLTDADGRVSLLAHPCPLANSLYVPQVRIPGFLDDVRKMDKEESDLLDAVVERCKE